MKKTYFNRSVVINLITAAVTALLSGTATVIVPIIVGDAVGNLSTDLNNFSKNFILVVILLISSAVLTAVHASFLSRAQEEISHFIRTFIVKKYFNSLYGNQRRMKQGEISSLVISDSDIYSRYFAKRYSEAYPNIIVLITIIFFMMFVSWRLSAITLVIIVIMGTIITFGNKIIKKPSSNLQNQREVFLKFFERAISRVFMVNALSANDLMTEKISYQSKVLSRNSVYLAACIALLGPLINTFIQISLLAVTGISAFLVTQGIENINSTTSFVVYLFFLMQPISSINEYFQIRAQGKISEERIDGFIKKLPENIDYRILELSNKAFIDISELNFCYDKADIIKDFDLKISKPGVYLINGDNGKGKTTLLNIIYGLEKPKNGKIRISYSNPENPPVVYSPQIVEMLPGSVKENILVGKINRDINEKNIINLMRFLNLKDDIRLDTPIDGGERILSGGERQKISLVRAVLSESDIVLLDEPTASVDSNSRENIADIINTISSNRIVLLASHDEKLNKKLNIIKLVSFNVR